MNQQDVPFAHPPLNPSSGSSAILRILVVAAILLAAGLATAPFERGPSGSSVGDNVVAPPSSSFTALAPGTSVPPASEAFAGREVLAEPAAPTF